MIDVIEKFFEKIKKDRFDLMVRKGFITKNENYSDELWKNFRNVWLSKPDI